MCLSLSTNDSEFCFLRLLVDCERMAGPGQQGKVAEIVGTSHEPQAEASGEREAPENVRAYPTKQEVLNVIALKLSPCIDPANLEATFINGFLRYLRELRQLLFHDVQEGSLVIRVRCQSLQILDALWKDYRTGHLNEMAQKYLVTEDILEKFSLTEVKLKTTIKEEEYRRCRSYFLKIAG